MAERTTTAPVEDRLVRPEKAADIADVSKSTIYRLMQDGTLPWRQVRGARRVRVSDVLALGT